MNAVAPDGVQWDRIPADERERLRQSRTDHLLLLIGSNPLPNWVAAHLLTRPGGTIWLLRTGSTEDLATTMEVDLRAEGFKVEPRSIDAVGAEDIYATVQRLIGEIRDSDREATIGLNYTGGTKAMSVHAHRAALSSGTQPEPVLSYMDAAHLRLQFDPRGTAGAWSCDIALAYPVTLDTLVSLHGWDISSWTTSPILLDAAYCLARPFSHSNPQAAQQWQDWCRRDLRAKLQLPGGAWKGIDALGNMIVPWPIHPAFQGLVTTLRTTLPGAAADGLHVQQAAESLRDNLAKHTAGNNPEPPATDVRELVTWLDGKWMESLVFKALLDLRQAWNLHDIRMNLRMGDPLDMEIDVVAMRGYQLFAFSCATTINRRDRQRNRADLKRKLFEVRERARQLGGDEARVALCCPTDDPVALENEVQRAFHTGTSTWVFGMTALHNYTNAQTGIPLWLELLEMERHGGEGL